MRVYVTGAAGFVGRRLVAHLRDADFEVVNGEEEVDVTDPTLLEPDLIRARPEAIVHLAALSSVAASFHDPAAFFRVNFLGTRCLLDIVSRKLPEARVLLVGSADQYDSAGAGARPYAETAPMRPRSPYARSKAAAEQLGTLAAERGLDVVRIRAFNHTGAGQSDTFVASSFARQVAEIAAGRREPVMRVGNLDSVRDFLDVADVVEAYRMLLDRSVPCDVYNVASERGVELRVLLDELLELAGVSPKIETDPERMRPTDQLVGDATRLREATGWKPRIALRDTLAALLASWREVGDA